MEQLPYLRRLDLSSYAVSNLTPPANKILVYAYETGWQRARDRQTEDRHEKCADLTSQITGMQANRSTESEDVLS